MAGKRIIGIHNGQPVSFGTSKPGWLSVEETETATTLMEVKEAFATMTSRQGNVVMFLGCRITIGEADREAVDKLIDELRVVAALKAGTTRSGARTTPSGALHLAKTAATVVERFAWVALVLGAILAVIIAFRESTIAALAFLLVVALQCATAIMVSAYIQSRSDR